MSSKAFNINDLFSTTARTVSSETAARAAIPKARKIAKPTGDKVKMNLYLTAETVERIKSYAERADAKLCTVIDRAITEFLERYDGE